MARYDGDRAVFAEDFAGDGGAPATSGAWSRRVWMGRSLVVAVRYIAGM